MKILIRFFIIVFTSIVFTSTALAKRGETVECKAQLARSSEAHLEVLPKGAEYSKVKLSKEGTAEISYTYKLNGKTDLIYRLDLNIKTKPSNWVGDVKAFIMDAKIWDLKNNKLIGTKTETSDNVRTRFLLGQLLDEDTAVLVTDINSFELRNKLITSSNTEVANLANKGQWREANNRALSLDLLSPLIADFASVHCFIED
jgi:hypothetical protein